MTGKDFDASKYLTDLNGKDYLEVKWRLLWLRTEHPDAIIDTELVKHDAELALFRARVAIPGAGQATGWGSETAGDFEDFIEKAETKALGRALAALGYGTQFCEDFDFSAERRERPERERRSRRAAAAPRDGARGRAQSRVVDAPVAPHSLKVVRDQQEGSATSPQVKAIYSIGRDQRALDEPSVEARCRDRYGRPPAELSKQQASEFIDLLRRPKTEATTAKPDAPRAQRV